MLLLLAIAIVGCHALTQQESSLWHPLPHFARREILLGGAAALATATTTKLPAAGASELATSGSRSIFSIDSNFAIPVWPSWGGGRVVPVSLGGPLHDPFLLLAHHKHWFDPRDPLRGPFKAVGKALGLPYVDVEGFKLHPHRGLDILTYILDGSDGFRHRDSLGGSRVYRGGCAQWMRTGSGVLHEEFWETRDDRRTNIELFQVWVNLPAKQKFDPPHIQYLGDTTNHPWVEHHSDGVKVRDIGGTLDASLSMQKKERKKRTGRQQPTTRECFARDDATWFSVGDTGAPSTLCIALCKGGHRNAPVFRQITAGTNSKCTADGNLSCQWRLDCGSQCTTETFGFFGSHCGTAL